MNPFLRTAYNYDMNSAGDESGVDCLFDRETGEATPSLTQQHFADECDINTIVKRFGLTGQLPQGVRAPTFGDFEDVPSYHEAMNAIKEADQAFYSMPADVRSRFFNDPGRFVDFCSDEANRAEAEKLGLVVAKPPAAAEVVPATASVVGAPAAPVAAPAAPVKG